MADKALQERHLEILVKNEGLKFTDTFFPYTSGQIGPYYIESQAVMRNGADYAEAVKAIARLVAFGFRYDELDAISGGETRDWMFSGPVAIALGKPHLMIYKNGKIIGADIRKKLVAHVADLNNEGSSPRDYWFPSILKAGGSISSIFFYVDRMEDGVQVMKDLGLQSQSVVQLDTHAWDYLKK